MSLRLTEVFWRADQSVVAIRLTYDDPWFAATKAALKAQKFRWHEGTWQRSTLDWYREDAQSIAALLRKAGDTTQADALNKIALEHCTSAAPRVAQSRQSSTNSNFPAPAGLTYLPFQRAGIAYILRHKRVLLGDEMGLGKTIQILGIMNADPSINSALIVVPASLRDNWLREAAKWLIRTTRLVNAKDLPNHPDQSPIVRSLRSQALLVVASYDDAVTKPWILNPEKCIQQPSWGLFAVDEAHLLKALSSLRAKTIFGEKPWSQGEAAKASTYAVFATGTPLVNRPRELYRLIVNLKPQWMWFQQYCERYCGPRKVILSNGKTSTKYDGATHLEELERKLRTTVLLRRLKQDVLKELPALERITIALPADTQASEAYHQYLAAVDNAKLWAGDESGTEFVWGYLSGRIDVTSILEQLDLEDESDLNANLFASLRAVDSPPSGPAAECLRCLSRARQLAGQAKLAAVIQHARVLLSTGEKVIIVAHHQAILRPLLREFRDVHAILIDGAVRPEKRLALVDKLQQSPDISVCLLSIQAGGVGLTLTAAAHLIFAELAWTPAEMAQAEARIHRLGQTRQVKTYWFALENSSDEHVMRLVQKKGRIILNALGDHSAGSRARMRAQAWGAANPDKVRQRKRDWRWKRRYPSSTESAPTGPVRRGRPPKNHHQTQADKSAKATARSVAWNRAHPDRVREIKRAYRQRLRRRPSSEA